MSTTTWNVAQQAQRDLGVSCETAQRLATFWEVLHRWQRSINLVGKPTASTVWTRHFADSAQLYALLPETTRTLLDVGSGAGFPGLVLAILGVPQVHLVEADRRKAAFLHEAARLTGAAVQVHPCRLETLAPFACDAITARAVAPLSRLIPLVRPFVGPDTVVLLPKGQDVDRELTDATNSGIIDPEWTPDRLSSRTHPDATILRIGGQDLVGAGLLPPAGAPGHPAPSG